MSAEGGTTAIKNRNAQDAHEAIRPTDVTRTPVMLKEYLKPRSVPSVSADLETVCGQPHGGAVYETNTVRSAAENMFHASASKIRFDGFLSVYTQEGGKEAGKRSSRQDPQRTAAGAAGIPEEQHFTQPPAHYTEASLVAAWKNWDRASEYLCADDHHDHCAALCYQEKKNLYITELGEVVNEMMKQAFPSIVDVNFTANMETLLDGVGTGKVEWKTVVENFWPDLDAPSRSGKGTGRGQRSRTK